MLLESVRCICDDGIQSILLNAAILALSASRVISQEETEITYTILFSILEARLGLGLVLDYHYFWPIDLVIV